MPRVLSKLVNQSEECSGVRFTRTPDGWLSEVITDAEAARFASIPGYERVPDELLAEPVPAARRGRKLKE